MEIINYDKENVMALSRCSREEIETIYNIFPSYKVETFIHTMDNYTMDSYFGIILDKMKKLGYTFLGVGNAPYTHSGRSMAVVFEDNKTFETYWYHVDAHIVEWWQEQVDLFLRKKEF